MDEDCDSNTEDYGIAMLEGKILRRSYDERRHLNDIGFTQIPMRPVVTCHPEALPTHRRHY